MLFRSRKITFMSHRTQDLPPLHGFARLLRELRYHEASRQFLAITFIVLFTSTSQPTLLLFAVSVPLVLAGVVLRLSASGHILKNEELTTTGPYSLVRHPLYSGNIMIILGFSISCGSWWAAPLALVFFYFYYPTAIEYEDRKLRKLFGFPWECWVQNVPSLIPRLKNFGAISTGKWSFIKSIRQNGEPVITSFILCCLVLVAQKLP